MNNAVALPVVIALGSAIVLMLFGRRPRVTAVVSACGVLGLLAVALYFVAGTRAGRHFVLRLGSWPSEVGVVWVVDRLSAIMQLAVALVAVTTLVYATGTLERDERRYFHRLYFLLLAGVEGALVTGDLFNLFVFFEVMLLASFVLINLGLRRLQLEHGFAYVVVNLVSSLLLFGGVGVVYGTAGTVNLAGLSARVAAGDVPLPFWPAFALVLVVFGVKAAMLPLFFWLPDSYPRAPLPVTALFAGLLTKVGVYALYRTLPLVAGPAPAAVTAVLLVLSAATMLVGVLCAFGRDTIRGILSFHIVSQIGYMVFGLALATPLGLAAGLYFTLHNMIVKTALLFAGGAVERMGDGRLGVVRGVAATHPWLAVAFFVPALSLAGVPPLGGFIGKLFLVVEGFRAGAWVVAGLSLLVGFFTLASMLKIWVSAFWGVPSGQRRVEQGRRVALTAPPLALAALSLAMGVGAAPVMRYVERAAAELLAAAPYRDAVLRPGKEVR